MAHKHKLPDDLVIAVGGSPELTAETLNWLSEFCLPEKAARTVGRLKFREEQALWWLWLKARYAGPVVVEATLEHWTHPDQILRCSHVTAKFVNVPQISKPGFNQIIDKWIDDYRDAVRANCLPSSEVGGEDAIGRVFTSVTGSKYLRLRDMFYLLDSNDSIDIVATPIRKFDSMGMVTPVWSTLCSQMVSKSGIVTITQ